MKKRASSVRDKHDEQTENVLRALGNRRRNKKALAAIDDVLTRRNQPALKLLEAELQETKQNIELFAKSLKGRCDVLVKSMKAFELIDTGNHGIAHRAVQLESEVDRLRLLLRLQAQLTKGVNKR
jgi:hypothetical protein